MNRLSLPIFGILLAVASTHAQTDEAQTYKNLAYIENGHARQKLDLYVPKAAKGPLPVIVWVHGGGWQSGSKEQCLPLREGYVKLGYAVASIGYRLSGDATFPAQIEDCKAAIRWLRAHAAEYNLDSKRFAAWGSSAGGHLVALLGTAGDVKEFDTGPHPDQSSAVQAVCDFYGPTDLSAFVTTPGYESHARAEAPEGRLIGGAVPENLEKAARADPIRYITENDPPFLIVHGDQDRTVPLGQSQLLFDALKKAGVSTHFHTIKGASHGGPAFSGEQIDTMVRDFFQRTILSPSAAKPEPTFTSTESSAASSAPRPMTTGTPPPATRSRIPWQAISKREDRNSDGKVTREEFRGPPAIFDRLDFNHDGSLTEDDFGSGQPGAPTTPESKAKGAMPPGGTASSAAIPDAKEVRIAGQRWTLGPLNGILMKPEGKGPFPAIIINHGLGSSGAQFGLLRAREFLKWGMVCIATDLTHARPNRDGDHSTFGASAENVRRARACLDILRNLPEVDPKRICAYGNSMGAFLTAQLASEWPEELKAAAITAGGVVTQPGFPAPTQATAAKIRVPMLILHGSADTTVPPAGATRLHETLDQNKVPNDLKIFDGAGHNLLTQKGDEVFALIRAWFEKHGVLTP